MNKRSLGIVGLISLGLLAGCTNNTSYRGPVVRPQAVQPTGITGKWNHTKGIFVANFNGGKFQSIATDTGKPVALGEYKQIDQQNVQLQWFGGASQSVRRANCVLVSRDFMRCVQTNGSTFEMQRSTV